MPREELMKEVAEKRAHGYNCCQIVTDYYAEAYQMDKDAIYRIAEGFAGGMGKGEGVCGALIAAVMVAGWNNSRGTDFSKAPTTGKTIQLGQQIMNKFKARNEVIICSELKARETGSVTCVDRIADAIECTNEVLGE